jgi:hypothetical protein
MMPRASIQPQLDFISWARLDVATLVLLMANPLRLSAAQLTPESSPTGTGWVPG